MIPFKKYCFIYILLTNEYFFKRNEINKASNFLNLFVLIAILSQSMKIFKKKYKEKWIKLCIIQISRVSKLAIHLL